MATRSQHILRIAVAAGAALLLASCHKEPPALPKTSPAPTPPAADAPAALPRVASNIDEYKVLVAERILASNPQQTFSGRLPPMLPAIVVLDIGIDRDGGVSEARVHRSRDNAASKVALAALAAGTPYPKPGHLLRFGHKTLVFSETFLFNKDYKFQLRTLAGPQ
ncbi:energy transducer TonB [Rugamonas sp. CCM 8940]|uniref:energy transducer TonB n=1 Tax=Rugamonas sp. CCM 8940 TaxID=2765359 RepID=UPI0018F77C0E|nr:energy transducer TonB [Rugamonas sp. CCM 8940]MBJ7312805.1 energy transducer TonB [Rugamonas sp. CCM 8940]